MTEVVDTNTTQKKKKKYKPYRYRCHSKKNSKKKNLWKPGEPLTEEDQRMLNEVRRRYKQLGYVPTKREVSTMGLLKMRFRTWEDMMEAAGLPKHNDPEECRKRDEAREWNRRMNEIMRWG